MCISGQKGQNTEINCRASTDKDGRFRVGHQKPGTYYVFAINEAEGYAIENQAPGQLVAITTEQPWSDVVIRLHDRGGILLGSVIDKVTGKKIENAQLHYTSLDSGGGGTAMIKGDFQVPVPIDSDLVIVVMARGYRGWVYTDSSNTSRPTLRLESGERREMKIELEPLPSHAPER